MGTSGQFEMAVAGLEAGQKDPSFQTVEFKVSNWLALAMRRQRLRQENEAATAFQSARAILTKEQREFDLETLIVQILFHEAEILLGK